MTLYDAIKIVVEELDQNSLEVQPFFYAQWQEAMAELRREVKRQQKRAHKSRRRL